MSEISPQAAGQSLQTLLAEAFDGTPTDGTSWFTESKKGQGLFGAVEGLTASQASKQPVSGHASIAAHLEHLRYSLSLANRWSKGEEPYGNADWSTAWKKNTVSDNEWKQLLSDLRKEYLNWKTALAADSRWTGDELTGKMALVVHVAYHLGAIRHMVLHIR
ncbi:MAG: DinB family protein [Candidatus Zixiibacteriota bacterium]